ncbi:hypothetical protein CR513_54021, partial [Mucuna pruriens]
MEEVLEACPGTLLGFIGEQQVEIEGAINRLTFGASLDVKTVLLRFTVVDALASYNIILGQPTLNQLQAIVSTPHLCMKYPLLDRVGTVRADQQTARDWNKVSLKIGDRRRDSGKAEVGLQSNVHLLELDPRQIKEAERRWPTDDLKEIQINQRPTETTKIGVELGHEEEKQMIIF